MYSCNFRNGNISYRMEITSLPVEHALRDEKTNNDSSSNKINNRVIRVMAIRAIRNDWHHTARGMHSPAQGNDRILL